MAHHSDWSAMEVVVEGRGQKKSNKICDLCWKTVLKLAASCLRSLDHLVGASEHRQRNAEAECFCSLQVDDQFDLDRLLDRHLRRLFALEDSTCIDSSLAVTLCEARSIAHQPTGCRELPESEDRGKRMPGRKYDKLLFSRIEECVASHDDRACSSLGQVFEGGVDFAWTARLKDCDLKPERASRTLQLLYLDVCLWIVLVYDGRDNRDVWHQLMQQLQPLCFHGDREQTNSGDIAAWTIECRHRARFDRIIPRDEYNRDRRSRSLGGCCRRASSGQDDHSYTAIHQLGR